ncbi:MAG TPA: RibD family protein [Phycisphaerae bacterium]|nr:RibD family protein [Phycisphaerae bacterium]
MLPHVILHNQVSVDGRINGFAPDLGLHYQVASRLKMDAHLAGSNTIFNPNEPIPPEGAEAFEPPTTKPDDPRPLMVVPDSRGRVRNWHVLRNAGYWRGMVALCSDSTPGSYLTYLRERHIECIVAGRDRVDLPAALQELNARHGVETVVGDSGGTLNGVLLHAGLVDEISLLINPCLVGGTTVHSLFRAPDPTSPDSPVQLRLTHLEKVNEDLVWLRYKVVKSSST